MRFMGLRDTLHSLALMTAVQLVTFTLVGSSIEGVEAIKTQIKKHTEIFLAEVAESYVVIFSLHS